jgi:Stage II sporulation protein
MTPCFGVRRPDATFAATAPRPDSNRGTCAASNPPTNCSAHLPCANVLAVFPRLIFLLAFLSLSAPLSLSQTVRIGVLGLFHSKELTLGAGRSQAVVVSLADQSFVLEPGSPRDVARIRVANGAELLVEIKDHVLRAKEIRAAARGSGPATFVLSVPGRITRDYLGVLTITAVGAIVTPIVAMDLETAVASAVLAESAPGAPLEALKAQAVVARSYYVAGGGRHESYDFCDLTHCQFLREPPAPGSPADRAASATHGLIVSYEEKPVATMFTRSCGGRTRTPAELGLPAASYPYFAVVCDICHINPVRWNRRVSPEDAALLAKGESGRLAVARRLGWNSVPSNNFASRSEDGHVILEGAGQGHGIGLCQRGAVAMALAGAGFREILAHYFPNTVLTAMPKRAPIAAASAQGHKF